MKKSELIASMARNHTNLPASDVSLGFKALIEYLSESLSNGQRIEIRGFGVFTVRHRAAKIGRNPKTGEPVSLPERYVPYFKPGKQLSKRVNNK